MSQIFPETVSLIEQMQAEYVQVMKERGLAIPVHTDWEAGLTEEQKQSATLSPDLSKVKAATTPRKALQTPAAPRKEPVLKGTSKAETAREIMRKTKDSGRPLEDIIQMIMDATGHDKALAKATYKANMGRVGITQ